MLQVNINKIGNSQKSVVFFLKKKQIFLKFIDNKIFSLKE